MNESSFRQFLATRTAIEAEAKTIFLLYAKIKGFYSPSEWEVEDIGRSGVFFRCYHHGEDESHLLPLNYLLMPNPENAIRADHEALLQQQAEEAALHKAEDLAAQELQERRLLERLILKYGVPNERS